MVPKKIRILFIDDDKVDRMAFERFMNKQGDMFEYFLASSINETKKILKIVNVDIIISDYQLGDGNALDLFGFVIDVPIIIATGAGNQETAIAAMKAGAYDYLVKDSENNYLKTLPIVVENAFNRKQTEIELDKYRKHLEELVQVRTAELQRENDVRKQAEKELKNVNEDLIKTNKDLKNFTYIIAHDIQEPLRKISSFGDFLLEDFGERLNKEGIAYIHRIQASAERMKTLIENLLEISVVGTMDIQYEKVNTNELIDEMLHLLDFMEVEESNTEEGKRKYIDTKGNKVNIHKLDDIIIESKQFVKVFQHLIGNALKYQRNDKLALIEILSEHVGKKIRFTIRDNGIGIESKFFHKIFIIFQRLHTRDKYPGTGIGLALCKKIIEYYGGEIWCESEVGKGSTFYFTLIKGA